MFDPVVVLLAISSAIGGALTLSSVLPMCPNQPETLDSVSYCKRLDEKLRETHGSLLLLEAGRHCEAFEVIASARRDPVWDYSPEEKHGSVTNATERLVRLINERKVYVRNHLVVDYLELHTAEGDLSLAVERIGELQTPNYRSNTIGLTYKNKLLLSLIGGGRIRSLEPRKKQP